jgi:glycoside/pentoside/hexuronide:cation symporter, GPH family
MDSSHDPRPPQRGLPFSEKIGYALGDTATNLVWRTLMVFLPIFYTDVFGLSSAAVGTLLLVCRYWDGITDLVMGIVADRTETRWGRYRPWILWTALPFGLLTVLTFTTFDLSYTGKLLYAYATYSGLILVFTASNIPYCALTGAMTDDPAERTLLSSYRFVFAFLGGLLTQGLNVTLVGYFGQGNDVEGYRITMIIFSAAAVLLLLVTFLTTRERVKADPPATPSVRQDLLDLARNRPWRILFAVGILFVTLTTLRQGSTMYYFKYYAGDASLATWFMVTGLLAAMAGAALTAPLARWLGQRRVILFSFAVAGITSAALYLPGPTDTLPMMVLGALAEFSTGPIVALFFAMLADAADYSAWKTGRRATGLVFSAGTVSFKFGTGIAGAMTGWLLSAFGYVPHAAQTAEALLGIRLVISVFPAAAAVLAILAFSFYPIDAATLRRIETDLRARS